jgi:hypothetical protein
MRTHNSEGLIHPENPAIMHPAKAALDGAGFTHVGMHIDPETNQPAGDVFRSPAGDHTVRTHGDGFDIRHHATGVEAHNLTDNSLIHAIGKHERAALRGEVEGRGIGG